MAQWPAMTRSGGPDKAAGTTDLLPARQRNRAAAGRAGVDRPQIAVINGMVKQHMTEFSDGDYGKHVRDLATVTSQRCRDRSPSTAPDPR